MSTIEAGSRQDAYALARTPEEYARLRRQARTWEAATGRALDEVGLGPGASCLDAGCGPGETMRLMAQRVGPAGRVVGVDVDAALGEQAIAMLHGAGHRQCTFCAADLLADEPIPGAPFDLVYARFLLYHLPRADVVRRLWELVAPGGHLLVQDYDVRAMSVSPPLATLDEFTRVAADAFTAAGCDVHVGSRLPQLFAEAGVGAPDGTDVAGRLAPLRETSVFMSAVWGGVLETALAHGITTREDSERWHGELARDAERFPERPTLWPLLIAGWKRKPRG